MNTRRRFSFALALVISLGAWRTFSKASDNVVLLDQDSPPANFVPILGPDASPNSALKSLSNKATVLSLQTRGLNRLSPREQSQSPINLAHGFHRVIPAKAAGQVRIPSDAIARTTPSSVGLLEARNDASPMADTLSKANTVSPGPPGNSSVPLRADTNTIEEHSNIDQELLKGPSLKIPFPRAVTTLPFVALGGLALLLATRTKNTPHRIELVIGALLLASQMRGCIERRIENRLVGEALDAVNRAPVVSQYDRPGVASIQIRDGYRDPTGQFADSQGQLLETDIQKIRQFLDKIPQGHLKGIPILLNFPIAQVGKDLFGIVESGLAVPRAAGLPLAGIAIDKRLLDQSHNGLSVLGHEIGHIVQFEFLTEKEKRETLELFQASKDPFFDFVEAAGFRSFDNVADPSQTASAYGSANVREDFASVYGNWVANSDGRHSTNDPFQNGSILAEAVERAIAGHPILLQKVLLVASLFADPDQHTVRSYFVDSLSGELQAVDRPYTRTPDALTLRINELPPSPLFSAGGPTEYIFRIKDGTITAIEIPSLQQPLYVLPQPIPISPTLLERLPLTA